MLAVVAALAATATHARAGVAVYTSPEVPVFVSDASTTDSRVTVPAGRTPVASVEVADIGYTWGASGQELSTQLVGPDSTSVGLWQIGCFSFPAQSSFTISDSALQPMPEKNACSDPDTIGTSFRPKNAQNRKLSAFAGKASAGTWTFRNVDNGVQFSNQGTLLHWALRVTHEPPRLNVSAPKAARIGKKLAVTVQANADGTVALGGGAKPTAAKVKAGQAARVPFRPKAKLLRVIEKKGKAAVKVAVSLADQTGGMAAATVRVTVKPAG